MKKLSYSVLDVFAEQQLQGNPLAVFHDARGLSDAEMQAIARETNLSETTFVLPSEDPGEDRERGVRVRIFTTQEELPFAGHPTLGTASWLHLSHPPLRGQEEITLRLGVGPIRVRFLHEQAQGVYGTMQQNDPVFSEKQNVAEVAQVIGMHETDLMEGYSPQGASTGNAFCIVALQSVEALSRLAISQPEATEWLRRRDLRWFYCIAPEGDPYSGKWRARMQFYGGEDPATGSAAGPCIAWLVKNKLVPSGRQAVITQGVEIHRPSRLSAQASMNDGHVHSILVGGRTIPVATGSFFLL